MNNALLISCLLGFIVVVQGGLNKNMTQKLGLMEVTLINNIFLLICSLIIFFIAQYYSDSLSGILRNQGFWGNLSWWFWIPGCMGIAIVIGIPYIFVRYGAVFCFIFLLISQIVASILWDYFIDHHPVTLPKIMGIVLAIASAVLVSWDSSVQ